MRNPDKLDTFPPEFFGLLKLIKKQLTSGIPEVVLFPIENKKTAQRKIFLLNTFRKSLQVYAPKSEYTEIANAVTFFKRPHTDDLPEGFAPVVFSVCARNRVDTDFSTLYKNPEFEEIMKTIEIPDTEVAADIQERIRQAAQRPAPSTQKAVDSILVFGVGDDEGDD